MTSVTDDDTYRSIPTIINTKFYCR